MNAWEKERPLALPAMKFMSEAVQIAFPLILAILTVNHPEITTVCPLELSISTLLCILLIAFAS